MEPQWRLRTAAKVWSTACLVYLLPHFSGMRSPGPDLLEAEMEIDAGGQAQAVLHVGAAVGQLVANVLQLNGP